MQPYIPTLDYTPPATLQTLQFSSEALNVIAISLLASFILANIGSLTSKLVQLTPPNNFTYRAWLRALIFAASDDPLRILSWFRRRYIYCNPSWTRSKSHLRPARLCVPLLARLLLLAVSVGLIALSIPVKTFASGCQLVDYAPIWNISRVASMPLPAPSCIPITLTSTVGDVLSVAEYCFSLWRMPNRAPARPGQTNVAVSQDVQLAQTYTLFSNSSAARSLSFYILWRRLNDSFVAYSSDVSTLDVAAQLTIVLQAIRSIKPECVADPIQQNDLLPGVPVAFTTINCELDLEFGDIDDLQVASHWRQLGAYYITGIQWQRMDSKQKRIRSTDSDTPFQESYDCPVLLSLEQPVLNIAPLAILLVASIVANLLVSWVTRRRGNALDSGYHIVKESLGHDTTTNPLEENVERKKITSIEIGTWHCTTSGGGHVGFIGRQGDVPVDEFDACTVVAQCARGELDLEAAQRLRLGVAGKVTQPSDH